MVMIVVMTTTGGAGDLAIKISFQNIADPTADAGDHFDAEVSKHINRFWTHAAGNHDINFKRVDKTRYLARGMLFEVRVFDDLSCGDVAIIFNLSYDI